jgi:aryl-alcohol dehydrogenase-like predicted oxidoreductase
VTDLSAHLGFGCVKLTAFPRVGGAVKMLAQVFHEAGINYFDTAPIYGAGYSEIILGKFLTGKRDQVVVATKFGLLPRRPATLSPHWALPLNYLRQRMRPPAGFPAGESPPLAVRRIGRPEIQRAFEGSLKNLRTDFIDVYLLHEGLPAFLSDEALGYLLDLRTRGMVKRLGLAVSSGLNFARLQPADLLQWDILQYEYGPTYPARAIAERFPTKTHVYHSSLHGLSRVAGWADPALAAGTILAKLARDNRGGRILFATAKADHLARNLAAARARFASPNLDADYQQIVDALSRS